MKCDKCGCTEFYVEQVIDYRAIDMSKTKKERAIERASEDKIDYQICHLRCDACESIVMSYNECSG